MTVHRVLVSGMGASSASGWRTCLIEAGGAFNRAVGEFLGRVAAAQAGEGARSLVGNQAAAGDVVTPDPCAVPSPSSPRSSRR